MATKRVSEKNLAVSHGAGKLPSTSKSVPSRRPARSTASAETPATEAPTGLDSPHDAVAALAYSYWLARGCEGGSPEDDWLRAEQKLRSVEGVAAASA